MRSGVNTIAASACLSSGPLVLPALASTAYQGDSGSIAIDDISVPGRSEIRLVESASAGVNAVSTCSGCSSPVRGRHDFKVFMPAPKSSGNSQPFYRISVDAISLFSATCSVSVDIGDDGTSELVYLFGQGSSWPPPRAAASVAYPGAVTPILISVTSEAYVVYKLDIRVALESRPGVFAAWYGWTVPSVPALEVVGDGEVTNPAGLVFSAAGLPPLSQFVLVVGTQPQEAYVPPSGWPLFVIPLLVIPSGIVDVGGRVSAKLSTPQGSLLGARFQGVAVAPSGLTKSTKGLLVDLLR